MQTILSKNRQARPFNKKPDLIIVHATAGRWAGDLATLLGLTSRRVSAHYLIGKTGQVVRLVPEDEEAWHAGQSTWPGFPSLYGSLNWRSIGIELENLNDGKDPYPAAQTNALEALLRDITRRQGIPLNRAHVVGHYEVSPGRKTDPRGLNLDAVVMRALQVDWTPPPTYRVIVTADVLNVRQGPKTSYPIVYQLRKGDSVECDSTKDEGEGIWHHLANGAGFISGKYVRRVT